jgi:hypothetical protein
MANLIQIKRSTTTDAPASGGLLTGELAYSLLNTSNSLFVGDGSNNAIRIGGGKYLWLHQANVATPGALTSNAVVITNGNSYVTGWRTNNLIVGADGTTVNVSSISTDANSTQLGASASGSNTELVTSYAIKTYVEGYVTDAKPIVTDTQVGFGNTTNFLTSSSDFTFSDATDVLTIGNTTVNTAISPTTITTGGTVNATALNIGANINVTTTSINVGNSSVNTVITATSIDTDGTLAVLGTATLSNTLSVAGLATLASANVTSSINVIGDATVNGALLVNNTASVGNTTITGTANVTSSINVVGAATVNGAFVVNNTASVGNTTIAGFANVSGDVTVNGALTVNNTAAVGNTTIAGFANVSSYINVVGDATVNGALLVNNTAAVGNTTITGFANVSSTLNVVGAATVNGAFLVNNTASVGNTTISGTANVTSSINVVGAATVNGALTVNNTAAIGNTTITGFANVSSTLSVGANAAFGQNVAITGHTSTGTLSAGDTNISGNLTVTGTLTTINTNNLVVQDALIQLATNNTINDVLDIGVFGLYEAGDAGVSEHAGLFRDASDSGVWKLFQGLEVAPTTIIDTSDNTFEFATLQAFLKTGGAGASGLIANATTIALTANSTLNVAIVANTLSLSTPLSGTSGGTGLNSFTTEDILVANSTNGFRALAKGADGTVLQISSGVVTYNTLDGGTF